MWMNLIVVLCILALCYGWVVYTVRDELDERGFRAGTAYQTSRTQRPTFTYCRICDICEAFQVGSEDLPAWAKCSDIEVIVLPEPKAVIHTGYGTFTAAAGDYVIKMPDNRFIAVPKEGIKRDFVKIEVEET